MKPLVGDPFIRYVIAVTSGIAVFVATAPFVGEFFGGPRAHWRGPPHPGILAIVALVGLAVSAVPFLAWRLVAMRYGLAGARWSVVVGVLTALSSWAIFVGLHGGTTLFGKDFYMTASWLLPGAMAGLCYWALGGMRKDANEGAQ